MGAFFTLTAVAFFADAFLAATAFFSFAAAFLAGAFFVTFFALAALAVAHRLRCAAATRLWAAALNFRFAGFFSGLAAATYCAARPRVWPSSGAISYRPVIRPLRAANTATA